MDIRNQQLSFTTVHINSDQHAEKKTGIKLYIYAVTLAALCSAVGVLWDISWHASIGRDRFFTPPHILIYMGGIFGGLFSAIQVLINTFAITREKKSSFVKVWGIFYASLGSLFCIWVQLLCLLQHHLIIGGTALMGLM